MLYLTKINKTYYFRLRIPLDMWQYFNRREIKRTLGTKTYANAKSLVKSFTAEAERIFTMIRSGVLTDEMIKKIVNSFVDTNIAYDEKKRNNEVIFDDDPELQKEIERDNEFLVNMLETKKSRKLYLGLSEWFIDQMRTDLSRRKAKDVAFITGYVDQYLKRDGIYLDKNSTEYSKLCNELLKGAIRVASITKEHDSGNYETDYDIEKRNRPKYMTLRELITRYEDVKTKSWADPSRTKSAHRQLLHIIGDVSINKIDDQTTGYLEESLDNYPRKLNLEDMGTPWTELSKIKKDRLSESSKHFIKTAFRTLINYAKESEMGIIGNPAKGIASEKPKCKNSHVPYTPVELHGLVNALKTIDRENNTAMFWIPLLLLYSGSRSNEICMLRCEDIELVNDIWTLRFNNKQEFHQKTKNNNDRQVPIHKHLLNLGFIEFVNNQKAKGNDRLFDKLRLNKHKLKWNVDFGKDFNRTFKKKFLIGYTNAQLADKTLHSFRKTLISWFIQRQDYSNVKDISILQSIIGHFEATEISFLLQFLNASKLTIETYGGGYGRLVEQNKLLQLLDYDLDLNVLHPIV